MTRRGVGAIALATVGAALLGVGSLGAAPDGPTISVRNAGLVEESGNATFTITIEPAVADGSVTVTYETVNGSASAGSDYGPVAPAAVTFEAGETSKQVDVPILVDNIDEVDETFALNLLTTTAGAISSTSSSGSATIVDDDPTPSLSIGSPSVVEGDGGSSPFTNLAFSVSLSNPSGSDVAVDWQTIPNGALSGIDYIGDSGTLTWAAGSGGSQTMTIKVIGDLSSEPDEQLLVSLSNPRNATIPPGGFQGVGTIEDDDARLSIDDVSVIEPGTGTVTARFTVTLTQSARPVTVAYATGGGTATAGSDYSTADGTLAFAAGETSKSINITVRSDMINEAAETFNVVLSAPSGAKIGDGSGQGTIVDPSAPPALTVSDTSGSEGAGAIPVAVTLTGAPSGRNITVSYTVQTGDNAPRATAGADFTTATGSLTFTPGQSSKTIAIPIVNDAAAEADENITVILSGPVGATLAKSRASVRIIDNDTGVVTAPAAGPKLGGGPTAPGPLPVTTPAVAATTAKATTARTFSAKLTSAKINAKLVKGRRQVALRVTLGQDGLARVTMRQGKQRITSAQFQLIAGRRIVYVLLPKAIKNGPVRLSLLVENAQGVKRTLSTKVIITKRAAPRAKKVATVKVTKSASKKTVRQAP
jgi:hypothetical protein